MKIMYLEEGKHLQGHLVEIFSVLSFLIPFFIHLFSFISFTPHFLAVFSTHERTSRIRGWRCGRFWLLPFCVWYVRYWRTRWGQVLGSGRSRWQAPFRSLLDHEKKKPNKKVQCSFLNSFFPLIWGYFIQYILVEQVHCYYNSLSGLWTLNIDVMCAFRWRRPCPAGASQWERDRHGASGLTVCTPGSQTPTGSTTTGSPTQLYQEFPCTGGLPPSPGMVSRSNNIFKYEICSD